MALVPATGSIDLPDAGPTGIGYSQRTVTSDSGEHREMSLIRKFQTGVANSVVASRLVPTAIRGRLYNSLGIHNRARFSFGSFFGGTNVSVGANSYVNAQCFFDAFGRVDIGRDCLIGMGVLFLTSDHEIRRPGQYGPPRGLSILVGDRCWIGARAIILPGVRLVDDVVVAAGAVVPHSIDAPGVYAGVPARQVR